MYLAVPILIGLTASQFEATANIGLQAENRTGERPLAVSGEQALVSEFEVVPSGALAFRFKRTTLSVSYTPRLYTRLDLRGGNTSESTRPLFLHGFSAAFTQAFTHRFRMSLSGFGSVGEVDYGNVNLVSGTPQQVPRQGAQGTTRGTSAAGSLPANQTTFATQNYGGNLSFVWDVARNHTITLGGGGNYNSSLGVNDTFPVNYGGSADLGWSWRFTPNYAFNLGAAYGETRVDPTGPGIGRFRSVSMSAGFDARFSRVFNASFGGGALIADNHPAPDAVAMTQIQPGISAIPTGNVAFTFIPTSGRGNFHLTTTFGVGLEGFVDPLQAQGFTPRVALAWNLNLIFYQDWSFTPNASLFTPASLHPPTCPQGTDCSNSLNETLISVSVPLAYRINDGLSIALGARISLRGTHLGADQVQFPDRFILGFLSFTAGEAIRL